MRASNDVRVVLAPGGLGSRVHHWARYLPKEFYPVGRPPRHCVDFWRRAPGWGAGHVAIVYHPYYRAFAEWAGQALSHSGETRYRSAAGRPIADRWTARGRRISFIAQHGRYGDLTSVLNGADHFPAAEDLYVAFADNLYFGSNPLLALGALPPGQVAVVARPYQPELAARRGVITIVERDCRRLVADLIAKPSPSAATPLERRHGAENLLLLEGRARVTADFIRFARAFPIAPGVEPKLALTIGAYAATHPVVAIETSCEVIDLGAPVCRCERSQLPVAKTSARQGVTISDAPFLQSDYPTLCPTAPTGPTRPRRAPRVNQDHVHADSHAASATVPTAAFSYRLPPPGDGMAADDRFRLVRAPTVHQSRTRHPALGCAGRQPPLPQPLPW